jgi:hypothetical protein
LEQQALDRAHHSPASVDSNRQAEAAIKALETTVLDLQKQTNTIKKQQKKSMSLIFQLLKEGADGID